ncbi:MAG: hypothetical protein ACPLRW_07295 [Moorellales bacterium]
MKTIFQCGMCGKYFSDQKECAEHEATEHLKPVQIETYEDYYFDRRYPRWLVVRMEDGAMVEYLLNRIREAAKCTSAGTAV